MGEVVDASHDALGALPKGLHRGLGEKRPVEPGDLEPMLEVELRGVAIEAAQRVADGEPLRQGLEVDPLEGLPQAVLTREEDGQGGVVVPIEIRQDGQEGEDVGAQSLGLVEDEEDAEVALVGEATDLLLDGAQRQGAGVGRLEAELEADLATEVAGIDGGVVEIDGAYLLGVELVAQTSQGGGFAAAELAGQEAETAVLDEGTQTLVELVEPWGAEELVLLETAAEGGTAEAVKVSVHHLSSSILRAMRSR